MQPEYGSPGRLTFDTADVIIAQPNPLWAPEPYTQQIQGCGQPGSFIHFTENFITDDVVVTETYGELGIFFFIFYLSIFFSPFNFVFACFQ